MQLVDTLESATGLYTIQEAAAYARIPLATLNYWHFGVSGRQPLRPAQIEKTNGKFLTFSEFVEALAVRNLRTTFRIPLPKIREAIVEAKNTYGIDFPFSQKGHQTLLASGKDLHIVLKPGANPVGLTGKDKKQVSMHVCIEQYMHDLEFDEHGMAKAYNAYRYGETVIRMDPRRNLGSPIVVGTGYTPQTLYSAAAAAESAELAAEYYEVNMEAMFASIKFCTELGLAA